MEADEPTENANASRPKKRKSRGPTKMKRLPSYFTNRVEVEFNENAELIDQGSIHLSSFLGPLVREHVPVTLSTWRHLDAGLKAILWDCIQVYFVIFM